jgi:hypothetical protein
MSAVYKALSNTIIYKKSPIISREILLFLVKFLPNLLVIPRYMWRTSTRPPRGGFKHLRRRSALWTTLRMGSTIVTMLIV